MPNYIKIDQTVVEIWRFNGFQNGGSPPSWMFEIQIFLSVCIVKRPIAHHHAKFREDRSIRCCDIATFVIFKMAATVVSSTFVCLAKALLNVEESARDNYVLDCNFAKYLPI